MTSSDHLFHRKLSAKDLHESRERYRETVRLLQLREEKQGFKWDILNSGLGDANEFDYFNDKGRNEGHNFKVLYPEGFAGTQKEVDAWHAQGKKVLMIDFMGQGEGCLETGADTVIATHWGEPSKKEGVKTIGGDSLSAEKIRELTLLIRSYKQQGYVISHVFFRPFGGANRYAFNAHARMQAYGLLCDVIAEMPATGKVFMQRTLGLEYFEDIAEIFKFRDCVLTEKDTRGGRGIGNNSFLFTKPSDGFRLPSIRQISDSKDTHVAYLFERMFLEDKIDSSPREW